MTTTTKSSRKHGTQLHRDAAYVASFLPPGNDSIRTALLKSHTADEILQAMRCAAVIPGLPRPVFKRAVASLNDPFTNR